MTDWLTDGSIADTYVHRHEWCRHRCVFSCASSLFQFQWQFRQKWAKQRIVSQKHTYYVPRKSSSCCLTTTKQQQQQQQQQPIKQWSAVNVFQDVGWLLSLSLSPSLNSVHRRYNSSLWEMIRTPFLLNSMKCCYSPEKRKGKVNNWREEGIRAHSNQTTNLLIDSFLSRCYKKERVCSCDLCLLGTRINFVWRFSNVQRVSAELSSKLYCPAWIFQGQRDDYSIDICWKNYSIHSRI